MRMLMTDLHLPRHRRVCRLCHTGALSDERHMLFECHALADLRDKFSPLLAECTLSMLRWLGRKEGNTLYNTPGSQLG